MRVIQITGRSNSGKTTFIKKLIPVLKETGRTAVIKHLADHEFRLENGKDTTAFFDAGAEIAVGIDSAKSVLAVHNNSLDSMLAFLHFQGIEFVIIEGFKDRPFKKIVIGDLQVEGCILRNPAIDDVLASIGNFDIYG